MNFNRTALGCVCVAAAMIGAARGQTQIDLRTQGKNIDFSMAARTRPSKTGTLVPAVCAIGETFLKTDAAAGKNLYVCTAVNLWTVQGAEVPDAAGRAGQVLTNDGSGLNWQGIGGDVSGAPGAVTVTGLNGRRLGSVATVPTTGQVLTWDGAEWIPQTPTSGGGGANSIDKTISNSYSAGAKQTFVPSLSTSGINIVPSTLPTNPAAGDISLDTGDANKLKIYDGGQWNTLVTVSNYVATVTAQTVVTINGTTHRLGTANLSVECYDSASPAARVEPDRVVVDLVTFNVSIYFASAQTGTCVITGSGGVTSSGASGAGMASQLGDLGLVLTSPTVLTAGLNCSNATPCNTRLGNTVYSVTNSSTITLTAGSGTLYLYVDASGALVAGHNLALTCAGVCGAVSAVTTFPAGSIPLFTWTATNGFWDISGGSDKRAFLSTRSLGSGTGIVALDTGTQTVVAVDSATVPTYITVTAVIDFASIGVGACAELPMTLPGASVGDSVSPGWPAGMESGLIGMMRVSASNTVAVRVCNLSGSPANPAAATFRATVVRSF